MSTLKRKFELLAKLQSLGFTFEESQQLRRISITLSKWAEMECGDGNDYASWSIERDETTQKPYLVTYPHSGPSRRRRVADREAGALKRLKAIVDARNAREFEGIALVSDPSKHPNWIHAYHQSDPRGCALYLVKASDLPEGQGETMKSILSRFYNRGLAVCA